MSASLFEDITQRWFIEEPALFSIYCTHHLEENAKMLCPIRTGRGVIEYNLHLLPENPNMREELLRSEVVRIMLRHPYERQPTDVAKAATGIASDMVLSENLSLKLLRFPWPSDWRLEGNHTFEWYASEVNALLPIPKQGVGQGDDSEGDEGGSDENSAAADVDLGSEADKVENWEEDDFMANEVKETLRQVKDWGSLSGKVVQYIQANLAAKIDYRRALAGFRASVQSCVRSLTRMRPNRRFEFEAMGSKYDMFSHILVAVDVSGSVTDDTLSRFFGIISKFFKHGVAQIDVIQFDSEVKPEVMKLDKAFRSEKIKIHGRGGTSFQPVFNYLQEHDEYDGAIIFTDGYASEPKLAKRLRTKILWACDTEENYNQHHAWMENTGRACFIQ